MSNATSSNPTSGRTSRNSESTNQSNYSSLQPETSRQRSGGNLPLLRARIESSESSSDDASQHQRSMSPIPGTINVINSPDVPNTVHASNRVMSPTAAIERRRPIRKRTRIISDQSDEPEAPLQTRPRRAAALRATYAEENDDDDEDGDEDSDAIPFPRVTRAGRVIKHNPRYEGLG